MDGVERGRFRPGRVVLEPQAHGKSPTDRRGLHAMLGDGWELADELNGQFLGPAQVGERLGVLVALLLQLSQVRVDLGELFPMRRHLRELLPEPFEQIPGRLDGRMPLHDTGLGRRRRCAAGLREENLAEVMRGARSLPARAGELSDSATWASAPRNASSASWQRPSAQRSLPRLLRNCPSLAHCWTRSRPAAAPLRA